MTRKIGGVAVGLFLVAVVSQHPLAQVTSDRLQNASR